MSEIAPEPLEPLLSANASTGGFAASGWTEEVRLAMAWNGGVSLAVWMGGVAVEIDSARRARPPETRAQSMQPPQATATANNTHELYKAICNAFDRRLVIDILAGASAGGLNGCLLAGAIVYDTPLDTEFLRDKWIQIGDFGKLLQPLAIDAPRSVMQGELFYKDVVEAFGELLGTDPPAEHGEVPVLLDVQATDVLGEERCFFDSWDQPFYAREYRSPLRFREWRDYRPGTLAAAARASASFPGAFEPQKLFGDAARIAGFEGAIRYAIDGGLLENAPIRPAIELLPRRRTNGPVSRYVCYVNAAPTEHADSENDPESPTLGSVLGYTFNLPREARVVDQLLILDDASRRAGSTADVGLRLLSLDHSHLLATATSLLPAYRVRRAQRSLEDLVGGVNDGTGPRKARNILRHLGDDFGVEGGGASRLPWIPVDLAVPSTASEWRWGVRAAQRILQLTIDLLTAALPRVPDSTSATSLLTARLTIEGRLIFLDGVYRDFVSPLNQPASQVDELNSDSPQQREQALGDIQTTANGMNEEIWSSLKTGVEAFIAAYTVLDQSSLSAAELPTTTQLFGNSTPTWRHFVGRALAVEVIRRTFSDDFDIESAQPLNVAQLTPMLPAPLFSLDAEHHDLGDPVPAAPRSARDKLAGLRVGHFAGFYRSSWRENDFMWGRFDGATAITRLLIDPERAKNLHKLYENTDLEPARQLARALVPDPKDPTAGDSDRITLLRELVPAPEDVPDPKANLESDLRDAIADDLYTAKPGGELTRALFARALQYEALREELPHFLKQLEHDRIEGAHRADLGWQLEGDSLMPVIRDLRQASGKDASGNDKALPGRLGCDDIDEATSNLGLRTISQVFLVALSALADVLPLTKSLKPVRVPLLAIRGASAQRPLDRLAVVLGFAGAAWYLVGRLLAIPSQTDGDFPLSLLWSVEFLAVVVSIFALVGVVAVPAVRGLRTHRKLRKFGELSFALALIAATGLVAAAWIWSRNNFQEAVTTRHSQWAPPETLLWVVVAAGGFQVASILNTVLKWTGPLLKAASKQVSRVSLILGAIGAVLAGYAAVQVLGPAIHHWGMKTVLAVAAFAAPAALAVYLELPVLTWRWLKATKAQATSAWQTFRTSH